MVTLTIDDKQVTVAPDATIYDAAKAAGVRIPILCHDKKLKPFGGCRMCLVEVEQMKGRQIPACTTPVTEGMIVRTSTEEIVKARKMVLELLLLKHPLDCPVCDAAGDCDLQNLTYEYQVNSNRFTDEKFHWEIDNENPLIQRDLNRCVHCGKCARICDEIVSFGAYSFVNRGIEAKIGTPFDEKLDCEFCGSCISVCPVGALNSVPFKFKARWWSLNKVKTVCSYCGTGCQLTLGVKDNKVLTTVYDENQGFHNGQLCCRGRFGYQFVNSDQRLLTPLVKKNGSLQPASWDEALALVADKLGAAKGDAAAALVSPRLTNEELYLCGQLFRETLGSDNLDHSAGFAHAALTAGAKESIGVAASPATIADIKQADLLLVVKTDTYETHPVLGFEINLAVKNHGTALRIVSDKSGKLSRLPDAKTLVHAPGAEVALINALAKTLLDEGLVADGVSASAGFAELQGALAGSGAEQAAAVCGLSADAIKELAREYAKAEKALIMLPLGLAYPGHGKALAQALLNLAILTGKLGKPGCGVLLLGEKNNSQGAIDLGIYPQQGGKGALEILAGCASGAIKALYVVGENLLAAYPDRQQVAQALDEVEFLVVQDLFLTETAQQADVVLPACSFAEKEGTFTSVGRAVQKVNRAIKPLGEARSDFAIFNALLGLLGGKQCADTTAAFAALAASTPAYAGLSYQGLGDGQILPCQVAPRLVAVQAPVPAVESGKFALLTGVALHHCGTLSNYGEGPLAVSPACYLEINSDDAASLKVDNGDAVTVASAAGQVKLVAKVSHRLPKGVVFAPYHFPAAALNSVATGSAVTWVAISK